MRDFAATYRRIFERLGYPLSRSHGLPAASLAQAERRLGVSVPLALRDYFLVTGRERRFNTAHNHLLPPSEWFADGDYLAFMAENQAVCWWAVSLKKDRARDPSVAQGVNQDEIEWNTEHRRCSTFLAVMLHYQAVSGGLPCCASAKAPDDTHKKLKTGWQYIGEVNRLWAFSRQDQVVCVMAGGSLPFQPAMDLLAAGKTRSDLRAIEESLSVKLR
jgi:hypothetical protein